MNGKVHKVLLKTAQLANSCGNQNLFRAFAVGTTKLSSNNDYSTKVIKKENFINIPKQLHNNKWMNIFVSDFKHYSSSSVNFHNNTTQELNPVQYKSWSKEDVCSLLCTPEESGGAGLTIEKVQPLYGAGFDGTSIANIVTHIQGKDVYFAVEQVKTNRDYQSISQITLENVVNWVDNLLKTRLDPVSNLVRKSITVTLVDFYFLKHKLLAHNPDLKSARTDPKFNYLRNLKDPSNMAKLEAMVGQNITLPTLGKEGSQFVPKDYKPTTNYLLTKQRFEILKKVVSEQDQGFVFSGPHGISKSYTLYLIAAYAIVNSIPLLYVPICQPWVSAHDQGGFIGANNYLRTMIYYWNYDILSKKHIENLETSIDVVSYMSVYVSIEKRVFMLFDEHNELFKQNSEGKILIQTDYFKSFSKWTGVTAGSMTIYCGSAHSKFENNLPGGAEAKLIRILPPSRSEFEVLIKDFGFTLDKQKVNRVEYATGRMPRELKLFADYVKGSNDFTDKMVTQFIDDRQDVYYKRLNRLITEESPEHVQSFLKTIHYLFNLAFLSDEAGDRNLRGLAKPPGSFYDQGVFYFNDSYLYTINEAAKRALFSIYLNRS